MYDLPSKFNKDLMVQCSNMVPWINFCKYFQNNAMGEPILKLGDHWYGTHQYSLEPIFSFQDPEASLQVMLTSSQKAKIM